MISNKLIAIDFGSTHITAMAAEVLESGELRILSDESKVADDIKWGIVEKPSGASFKVNELLRLLKNSAKIPDISSVSVSVGAKSMKQISTTVSRFIPKPNLITEDFLSEMFEECKQKVQNPEVTVFDVIPVSYLVDGKRMDEPVGQKASQIIGNYHVVVGNAIIKSELDRCFDRTGIVLEYNPLAAECLATVVIEEQEKEVGCALINFGATTTTLAVYHEGALQNLLVVPLGAKNITKDIQELGVSEEHAERLKCLKGYALDRLVESPVYVQIPSVENPATPVKISTKFLATIIEARMEEILQPVFDIMNKLTFSLEGGIVITGGGSKLKGLIELIHDKTGIYTRMGNHAEWLTDQTPERYRDTIYSQLIGTLLLTNEHRKEHPVEEIETKPVKIPRKKPWDKLADNFITFFGDDNKMN
jgi:cell division protein FtsA